MLVLALLILLPSPAGGWSAVTHCVIAARAAERLGGPVGALLLRERRALLEGAVAPDRRGPGHIPAQDHVYHVAAEPDGSHFGGAPRRARTLLWELSNDEFASERAFAYLLGRLCHITADICQPLHTAGGKARPREHEFHARYERDADRLVPLLGPWATHGDACADVEAFLKQMAARTNAGYASIEQAYTTRCDPTELRAPTLFWMHLSVEATLAAWRSIPPGRPIRPPDRSARWPLYALGFCVYLRLCRPWRAWLRRTGPRPREVCSWKR